MAYKAVSKAEAKRFIHEVRKAHDVIIERTYAKKDTVTAAINGLAPKLPDDETKFLNGKGQWVAPSSKYTLPVADRNTLGGVKIASNTGITIDSAGVISIALATPTAIGGIQFPRVNAATTYLRGDGTWSTIDTNTYTLPIATRDALGGVIVGDNISISSYGKIGVSVPGNSNTYLRGDGTWSTIDTYTLPVAARDALGGVIVGDNISISSYGKIGVSVPGDTNTYLRGDGTWATPTDTKYTLSSATRNSLGGVIVGDNISVDANGRIGVSVSGDDTTYLRGDGTWSTIDTNTYTLPVATTDSLGGVIVGDNISVDANGKIGVSISGDDTTYLRGDGTWSTIDAYTLSVATTESLGGVIIGDNISISADGKIGVSVSGDTNTYLRGDGTWATPDNDIYTLPTASDSVKGGAKIGMGLTMTEETLSVNLTTAVETISDVYDQYVIAHNGYIALPENIWDLGPTAFYCSDFSSDADTVIVNAVNYDDNARSDTVNVSSNEIPIYLARDNDETNADNCVYLTDMSELGKQENEVVHIVATKSSHTAIGKILLGNGLSLQGDTLNSDDCQALFRLVDETVIFPYIMEDTISWNVEDVEQDFIDSTGRPSKLGDIVHWGNSGSANGLAVRSSDKWFKLSAYDESTHIGDDFEWNTINPLLSVTDRQKLDSLPYELPIASDTSLGGIKIAENTGITIGNDGIISITPASSSVVGGIQLPSINTATTYLRGDGTWATPDNDIYTLPVATNESLGGVIVGDNISVDANGKIGVSVPGDDTTYLRGDGTWVTPPDTKYTLPVATNESLGGVIVGDNISVDANGKIGVSISGDDTTYLRGDGTWSTIDTNTYTLPVATNESLGGVIVGDNISVDANGKIGVSVPGDDTTYLRGDGTWSTIDTNTYTLPVATNESLGGVIVGDNISVDANGKIGVSVPGDDTTYLRGDGTWVTPPDTKYTLPVATNESLGGVIVGDNISVDANGKIGVSVPGDDTTYLRGDGTWSTIDTNTYTLPVATNESLGGVIVGDNISVDANGKIGVSISGDDTTYLRGDGTWSTISSDNYKGAISINISTNRNVLAQSIALNGITSTTLETLVPTITSTESPNEGDHYIVANTDPLLDIYEGDYIIYQNHSWKYVKSSGLRSKSLSFKGYITSSEDLTLIATATDDSLSSSTLQSSNSSIGDMWLMQTTLGSLEQGDLILRTGPGETDWKVIHERPISSSGSGGIDFTAGRGLELTSNNILNVDFTDCSDTNAIPAANVVFNITKRANPWTSSLQIQTYNGSYIDIVQGVHCDGIRIGSDKIFDYYFEEDSGGDDYYY